MTSDIFLDKLLLVGVGWAITFVLCGLDLMEPEKMGLFNIGLFIGAFFI